MVPPQVHTVFFGERRRLASISIQLLFLVNLLATLLVVSIEKERKTVHTITSLIITGQLVASHAAALLYHSSVDTKADLGAAVVLRAFVPGHHC